MITLRLRHIILFTFAFLLTACQFEDSTDCPKEENVAASYINLTIAVSNSDSHSRTREGELPTGGENGDGREAGFERENAVTGITLILYHSDDDGINTTSDPSPTLDFVRFFPVTKVNETLTNPYEAYYTTGDQPVGKPNLDFSGNYHAIVIANQMLPSSIIEGTSKLSDLLDLTTTIIYSGNATQPASSCGNFVMTSEKDNTINFSTATKTEDTAGDKHYDLSGQPLVIERMAARIDFWSANSNGYKTNEDNAAYTIPGYEYPVVGSSEDKFVVTGIVPFNLVNGNTTYGVEYLLKRICTDISSALTTTSYLADETTTSYVLDPNTMDKAGSTTPALTSSLEGVYTLISSGLENTTNNPYYHSIASMHESATASSTIDNKENVVVCYPMENTLLPSASKLYYHATGIAIVGYYYQGGTGTGKRYVYLGYMRHQGNAASYDVSPSTSPLGTTDMMPNSPAMNFGVVRNNIYRVSINSVTITPDAPRLKIKIEEEKWRHVDNPIIYI